MSILHVCDIPFSDSFHSLYYIIVNLRHGEGCTHGFAEDDF